MSTAIFDYVETMRWREANILAGGMVVFAFVVILSMTLIQKRFAGPGHDGEAAPRRRRRPGKVSDLAVELAGVRRTVQWH